MLQLAKQKRQEGFTIIEVMIVLAIAGLIMVIVFLAIPQLQRSQRNTRRKDVVGRIKAEVDNYSTNNNGKYPTQDADTTSGFDGGFKARYLSNVNIEDPQSGSAVKLTPQASGAAGAIGVVNYTIGVTCDGESLVAAAPRNYALYTQLEGGATYCVDNK